MISITFGNLNPSGARQLLTLYESIAGGSSTMHAEMSASEHIATSDRPDAGADLPKSAAAVFTAGQIATAPQPGSAAAVFTVPAATHVMLPLAGTTTYEAFIAGGWTDAQLIESGRMLPNVQPAPSTAVADPSQTVHGGQPSTSTAIATAPPPPAPPSDNAGMTAAAPTPPATPALLDSNGIRWDARIHAGTRTCTAKGAWKVKKGVDEALVAQVTAELRGVGASPNVQPSGGHGATPAPHAPSRAPAPPPPSSNASTSATIASPFDFVSMCRYATSKFNAAQILSVCEKNGISGLGQINGQEHLIPKMFADFEALPK